ncbi:D-ala D-ala ligase [Aspergillus sclerotialis]|uniref:D-ala D-ala ligase n=1 Tax=Aspergillus sclerotialis TaxID=2070753 RepID=A0A3A2ZB44_9EURO|nr:D-ala D-ala ligase [Aspergillus sclerotialis]
MSSKTPVVAVLFQAIDPPIINGVRKPRKPGGYQDSGADIAYSLQKRGIRVITPNPTPSPSIQEGWCFPDTENGIIDAVRQGATHLWANTILFSSHPLQVSGEIQKYAQGTIDVVGQPPSMVERFDDKALLNDRLRDLGRFTLPKSWILKESDDIASFIQSIEKDEEATYPIVGKPVRGRGSHGVKVCYGSQDLQSHISSLFKESPLVMLEQFLAGEEATITVMPPAPGKNGYTSFPPVERFNHDDGVAPYNGVVAVTRNSRVVSQEDMDQDSSYGIAMRECEQVVELIQAMAPIRIDIRRFKEGSRFALFDINMKPNMTGPGRPGREDQASLSALAAAAVGWDYPALLGEMLKTARPLEEFREFRPVF